MISDFVFMVYMWYDATSGGPDFTIADNNTLSASFVAPRVETPTYITAALYVHDGHTDEYDIVLIVVTPSDYPPVDAGPDQAVGENTLVSLQRIPKI